MLENLDTKQRKIVLIIGIIVGFLVMVFIYQKAGTKNILEKDDSEMLVQNFEVKSKDSDDEEKIEQIIVHIAGEIKTPGIVKLKEGERIEDAIEKAGGLTENADISRVNLAYVLEDGVKIIIPKKNGESEESNIINEDAGEGIILEESFKEENKVLININKATQTDLEKLTGVGASLASKIIEYRDKNGKFQAIEDIKNVSRHRGEQV